MIVDVLSFSTTMSVAVERGLVALSYSGPELDAMGGRDAAAAELDATVVAKTRAVEPGVPSLSPASLAAVEPGRRVVFTSLNGARCTSAASDAPAVLIGCLRNLSATGRVVEEALATGVAPRCTIVPCLEQWTSSTTDTMGERFSAEDWLGAGALAAALAGGGASLSAEASFAATTFEAVSDDLAAALAQSISGRELVAKGFRADVDLAAEVDATDQACVRVEADGPRTFAGSSAAGAIG